MLNPEITRDPNGILWLVLHPDKPYAGVRVYDKNNVPITRTFDLTKPIKLGAITKWEGSVAPYTLGAPEPVTYPVVIPPPPPPPPATSVPRAGISCGGSSLWRSDADMKFELDQIRSVGAKVVRIDCDPQSSHIDATERFVKQVLARGMEALIIIGGWIEPSEAMSDTAWRTLCATIRDRFVPLGVRLFETSNEPAAFGVYTPQSYARQAVIAYEEIHKAPNTLLGVGALAYPAGQNNEPKSMWVWAQGIIPALGGKYDAFSWHPYNDPQDHGDWSAWDMAFGNSGHWSGNNNIVGLMKANGGVKPFWATECGDTVIGPNAKSLTYQANAVSHAITDPRVQLSTVFTMMDDDVPGFGLLDGNKNQRPAWSAFKSAAATVSGFGTNPFGTERFGV